MKILVCANSGIGNTITAMPLIQVLLDMGHEVSVVISESRGTRQLIQHLPVTIYDRKDNIPMHDLGLCTVICQAYTDESCKKASKHFMITPGHTGHDRFSIKRYTKHEFEHNIDLARKLGYTGKVPRPQLPLKEQGTPIDREHGVCLGIGHFKNDDGMLKHWGNTNFARLIDILSDNGWKPYILGGPDDTANAAEICDMTHGNPVNFTNIELAQTFSVMQLAGRIITNETMLVPAAYEYAKCLSMIFDEALNNPIKTLPYPSGVALCGAKADITPEIVYKYFVKQVEEGCWTRAQRVPDTSMKIDPLATNIPDCVSRGMGKARPKASVVSLLCDFDDPSLTETNIASLQSILDTSGDCEVINVLNNPSPALTDAVDALVRKYRRLITITTSANLGVVAKNLGYNVAQGKYIFSVDGDVKVTSGWLEKGIYWLEQDNSGIIGPCGAILNPDHWYSTNWPVGTDIYGYEDTGYFGAQTASGKDGIILDTIPSMAWGVNRKVFETCGYLSWRFGPFVGSDADMCFRAKLAGFTVRLVRLPIYHNHAGGTTHSHIENIRKIRDNHLKELHKLWYPLRSKVCEKAIEKG